MKYLIVVVKTKTGYSAYSPDVDGCIATGRTRSQAESRMRGALLFHLEGLRDDGARLPRPHSQPTFGEVPA